MFRETEVMSAVLRLARGSQDANWIKEGFRYEFRLYNAAHTQLLDKVVVTKATA